MADDRNLVNLESKGALTVGGGKDRVVLPFIAEIFNVSAVVGTAPTGASLILDITKNGTSIFTTTANRPTIAAGSTTSGVGVRPDVVEVNPGDVLELQVAQIGSTVAGSDLDVAIQYAAN